MPKKLDPELKARAVRLVLEHRAEYPTKTAAVLAVAKQVGVGKESLRRWVAQAEIDAGEAPRGDHRGERGDPPAAGGEPSAA